MYDIDNEKLWEMRKTMKLFLYSNYKFNIKMF